MKIIEVRAKPNARRSELTEETGGQWVARVKAPPSDGAANRELIALVAKHFGVAKASVTIKSGGTGRTKLVQIAGA